MIHSESRPYEDADEELTGVFVWDDEAGARRPGVLVIHGGAGLDDHARGRARRFAEAGFVAFACDMYGASVRGNRERVMKHIGDLRRDRAALCRRARAGIDVLASHPKVNGQLAAVGYCFGGMVALELARGGVDLGGVVSVHGGLETTAPAAPASMTCRILVCHGALDPHVPMSQVDGFVTEMNAAGADYQLLVYSGAMHGFTHEAAVQPVNGVAYHAVTDARSSRAIDEFLRDVWGGASPDVR